ncbi:MULTISPECIES: hypothetical protein [Anaerotruncus]|uniref:hypothetical protein n=1 Tax=Anaerotruncus TaxID=244127 RepID=UPI00082E4553|nr:MULTISPECIES: hypothetical protein [Anaerotruncus]RGX51647.1 hypothetical protein DWV16_18425 [Anaerotruncus sp. AF02-27]
MKPVRIAGGSPKIYLTKYTKLKGVDMSTDPSQIGEDKSPWCPNLISDNGGNPEKRLGWRTLFQLEAPVNGLWCVKLKQQLYYFAHGASKLYLWKPGENPQVIRENIHNAKSTAFTMAGKMWFLTGAEYLVYGEFDNPDYVKPAEGETTDVPEKTMQLKDVVDVAFVPTTVIGRAPTGGGVPYEAINLLSGKQINRFLTTSEKTYQLSATDIKSVDEVKLNEVKKTETTDYTVDLKKGTITFKATMPSPLVDGADNLYVTFTKEYKDYADRVKKCTIAAGYGVGTNDRVFISGNPDMRNTDWYSGLNDPSYFGDTTYANVGGESTAIMGYLRLGEYLAVVKEENQQDSTVYMRSAQLDSNGGVQFPLKQGVAGVGAIARGCFATLKDEPLFLARTGVYAVTSNLITYERTLKNRSYFVDAVLRKEPDLQNAVATEWNGYYVLVVNGNAYLLDANSRKEQVNQYTGDYAYRCYHWTNIPAVVIMEHDGELFFGTNDGRICKFNTDIELMTRYNDDNAPVVAEWATKFDDDGDFTVRKTMVKKGSGVLIKPSKRSSVKVTARTEKDFGREIKYATMDIFDWDEIDFNRFTFNTIDTPQVVPFNTKIKKYIMLQIIVRNDALSEGFGIYGIEKRYTIGNYVK